METKSMKRCWICKQTKPLDQFAENAAKNDGHRSECVACRPLEKRVYNARRSARKVGSAVDLTIRELKELMTFSTCCIYCGKDLSDLPATSVNLDHLIPLARQGDSTIGNIGICCESCNKAKGSQPAALFTEDRGALVRFVSIEKGISREEAAIDLLSDALQYSGVTDHEQIAAAAVILDSFGISHDAPHELLVEAIRSFFATRFSLILEDPRDIETIRSAIHALQEFEKEAAEWTS